MVRKLLAEAADSAIFGLLCMIDNVRAISDGGELELRVSVLQGDDRYDLGVMNSCMTSLGGRLTTVILRSAGV